MEYYTKEYAYVDDWSNRAIDRNGPSAEYENEHDVVQAPDINKTSKTKTNRQEVRDLYDEDHYALPDLEADTYPAVASKSSIPDKKIKSSKSKHGRHFKIITTIVVLVLVGAIAVGAFFLAKEPSQNDSDTSTKIIVVTTTVPGE